MIEPGRIAAIVANPGRQHTDHLAVALHQQAMLAQYFHGLAVRDALRPMMDPALDCRWSRYRYAVAATNKLLHGARRVAMAHRIYRQFGYSAARRAAKMVWNVVISAENSALPLFEEAARRGALKIIDAASVHHSWQVNADTQVRAAVNANKDQEIALADHIFTCSTLARQSYVGAGVDPDRVHVMPLGVDLAAFAPAADEGRSGPLRLLFVGRGDTAKGVDVLADACGALRAQGLPFTLDCVGPVDAAWVQRLGAFATIHGKVQHGDLPDHFRRADLLLHPSRFDSFGLVVAESLACGTPVMLSDNTGAADLVADGVNGWVLPTASVGDWIEALRRAVGNVDAVRAMRRASRQSTAACDWRAYHTRVAAKVRELAAESGQAR